MANKKTENNSQGAEQHYAAAAARARTQWPGKHLAVHAAELALKSASRAQSFYAPGSTHLGSLSLRHLNRLQVNQWAELGPLLLDRDQ